MNVKEVLKRNAKEYPEKSALIFNDNPISFLELKEKSFKLAGFLLDLGLKAGDTVAIYLPNIPEYVYSYLGVWIAGLTSIPLDFMLTEDEIINFINHAQAKVLICASKTGIQLETIKKNCPSLEKIILCRKKQDNFIFFEDILNRKEIPFLDNIEFKEKNYAIIFYTSGTTGRPKGVLVNYKQLSAPALALEYFVDLNFKDIALCAVPFSHLGGLVYIQAMLWFGITIVLMERFLPLEFLKNISKYKVTCFWIVPSMYYAFLSLKEFETLDLSSLRWIVTFGASSSPDALRRFHQFCPQAHLLNGWGLTETNAPTTVIKFGSNKIESVGRPAPWIEVKVVDENDRELPQGEIGEVVVKGWVVSDGYYKNEEETKKAFRNGWFHTGDMGKFDEEGDLYIVGRIKEMIKVGGEIVFEPEVEAVIMKHPQVKEVAVVGVKDKLRGEVPKAYIVLKDNVSLSEEDLREFCRKYLAHFKIPHYFEFVKDLPKNRTGKVNKQLLREGGLR